MLIFDLFIKVKSTMDHLITNYNKLLNIFEISLLNY